MCAQACGIKQEPPQQHPAIKQEAPARVQQRAAPEVIEILDSDDEGGALALHGAPPSGPSRTSCAPTRGRSARDPRAIIGVGLRSRLPSGAVPTDTSGADGPVMQQLHGGFFSQLACHELDPSAPQVPCSHDGLQGAAAVTSGLLGAELAQSTLGTAAGGAVALPAAGFAHGSGAFNGSGRLDSEVQQLNGSTPLAAGIHTAVKPDAGKGAWLLGGAWGQEWR